jgi:chromate reductase, NAD(P)H dehydrogenase (quinone)
LNKQLKLVKVGIVVGTNRQNSFSKKIAEYYQDQIKNQGYETELIDLATLPADFAFSSLYKKEGIPEGFLEFQKAVDTCNKLIFVVPEYNGSFPGVLKAFIDGLRHPDSLANKKACLVGLSAGVLGNAVGLGHLNDVLSYLNANVLGLRIKLGEVSKHFSEGQFSNETYRTFVDRQIKNFLDF